MPLCRCLIHTIKPGKKADRLLRETGKNFAVIFVCAIQPGGYCPMGIRRLFRKRSKAWTPAAPKREVKPPVPAARRFGLSPGFGSRGLPGSAAAHPRLIPLCFFCSLSYFPLDCSDTTAAKRAEGAAPMKGTAPSAVLCRPTTARRYTSHTASLSREGGLYRHFLFNAMFFLLLCGFPPNEASADKRQPTCRFPA